MYLILHKVRGEPAFDIAQKLQIGAEDETKAGWIEEMWIIPTSGHRAYPYWHSPLTDLRAYNAYYAAYQALEEVLTTVSMPDDHPDHYKSNDDLKTSKPRPSKGATLDDLERML